jgi:hypothetical protein
VIKENILIKVKWNFDEIQQTAEQSKRIEGGRAIGFYFSQKNQDYLNKYAIVQNGFVRKSNLINAVLEYYFEELEKVINDKRKN